MTTKKRSKPLEILASQSKNKDKKELSPIENELLECYEDGQPVLLYGDNSIDLEELIRKVYTASTYYIDFDTLGINIAKKLKLEDDELVELKQRFEPEYIDCGDMDGKEVYEKLAGHDDILSIQRGFLFEHDRTVIIDNLHCGPEKDEKDYRKLGKIIKYRGIGCTQTTFNWLVAYAHDDPQNFPEYFRDQFEPILLDRKRRKTLETGVINELRKLRDKESKVEVGQQEEVVGRAKDSVSLNIFRYKGGCWEIAFDGKTIYPTNKEGFYYISYVLSNPQTNLHNYRIYQKAKGLENGEVTEDQKFEENLYTEGSTKPKTKEVDKSMDYQDYEVMVAALDSEYDELREEREELEIDSVDLSRLGEIEERLSQISETRKLIAEEFKSGGKNKTEKEKTVYNVYKNIRRSLQIIKKEHPSLHAHFEAFFTNDKEFAFYNITPEMNISWQTSHS